MIPSPYSPGASNPATQPGMLTGGDLSDVPLVQLNQLVQQGNPGVKAAAILELAKRSSSGGGGKSLGVGGSSLAPIVAAGGMPMGQGGSGSPGGAQDAALSQMQAMHDPDAVPGVPSVPQTAPRSPIPPANPALDAISTGAGAAAGVTNATPPAFPITTPGQNPGLSVLGADGQSTDDAANPGVASIGAMAPAAQPLDIHPAVTTADKLRALSKGFFTLASSKQPGFLGAIGEGGNAAADALQAAQDRAQQGSEFGVSADQAQQQINSITGARAAETAAKQQQILAVKQAVAQLPPNLRAAAMADPDAFFGAQFKSLFDTQQAPAAVQEYKAAVDGGFRGSFVDYQVMLRQASASNTQVKLPPTEDAFSHSFGGEEGKSAATLSNQIGADAQSQLDTVGSLRQSLAALKAAGGDTGKFAPIQSSITSTMQALGMDPSSLGLAKDAGPYQQVTAITNKLALQARNTASGTGMPGAMSDPDRIFLQQSVPNIQDTPQGIEAKMQIVEKVAKRNQEMSNSWNSGKYPQTQAGFQQFKRDWQQYVQANPIFGKDDISGITAVTAHPSGASANTLPAGFQ